MTLTLSKPQLALAILAVVLIAPATALATHVFDDVPDGAFYSDAVEWAAENDITQGRTPSTFDPSAGVTRAESVTFLHRYDTNVVEPALDQLTPRLSTATASGVSTTTGGVAAIPGLSIPFTVPAGESVVALVNLSATSTCTPGAGPGSCWIDLLVDGTSDGSAFMRFDTAGAGAGARAAHWVSPPIGAGEHTLIAGWVTANGATFELDLARLTVTLMPASSLE